MKKWEYRKGCEADFVGGHTEATHKYLHKECKHPVWTSKPEIIKEALFDLVALREPGTDEDDLNECIGAPEADTTEQLITERGSRYGKFKDGAEIMQELKDVMREVDGWHNLTPSQREALDMIQHKIGRILNGDPTYDDSWKDIAGYATLIVNELNGEIK
jgi:hypothetical protein